jgi:hypothetical protein
MINLEGYKFDSQNLGQRSIGDMLEDIVKFAYRDLSDLEGSNWEDAPTVRSIQDFSVDHILYDVKTTDLDRDFSMPNLISAKRLIKLYSIPENELRYVLVSYKEIDGTKIITKYEERPIETIPWSHLGIQNLGEGQIQLLTAKTIPLYEGTRDEWIAELKTRMLIYLDHTIEKMHKRKIYWSSLIA